MSKHTPGPWRVLSEMEIDAKLPEGVDFGDLDKLHERIEEAAWERLHDYAEERE